MLPNSVEKMYWKEGDLIDEDILARMDDYQLKYILREKPHWPESVRKQVEEELKRREVNTL